MEPTDSQRDVVASPSGALHPLNEHEISAQSPPEPPRNFNPPADDPISPTQSISSPADSPEGLNIAAGASSTSLSLAIRQLYANRPQLRDLQRVSNDSIRSPGSEGSTGTPHSGMSSEFGEHLVEARDRLLSESGSGSPEGRSRGGSMDGFEFSVINPTPPSRSMPLEADSTQARRHGSVLGVHGQDEEGHDLPPEHAWDSVWPAAGTSHRPVPPDTGSSRFPVAPINPYSTPTFSPAVIPVTAQTRKPSSPMLTPRDKRPSSPLRISPRKSPDQDPTRNEYFASGRRRSIVSPSSPRLASSPTNSGPLAASTSKHARSLSNSSPTTRPVGRDSLERTRRSPPLAASPPSSPLKRGARISPPHATGLPPSVQLKKQDSGSGAGPSRLTDLGLSPPSSSTMSRPRGRSVSGIRHVVDPIERRDSPHPRQSPRNLQIGFEPPPALSPEPSFPPIALPPAVASAPPARSAIRIGEDTSEVAVATPNETLPISPTASSSPPLFPPSARPAVLRRALSDYDANQRVASPSFLRHHSAAEVERSPKETQAHADLPAPVIPGPGEDPSSSPPRTSPRSSPTQAVPIEDSPVESTAPPAKPEHVETRAPPSSEKFGEMGLVDEGDILPSGDFTMDVTFDDEGLNTLERIFLLSKSEYPFHRSYVARVLGDLLNDVDPCESVEYVLPLLSGFSMDEDESVKEAFASELHRILWYFYSTCKLVGEQDVAESGAELEPEAAQERETLTITSEGVSVVPTPTAADIAAIPIVEERRNSLGSLAGPSSAGSSLRNRSVSTVEDGSTPASTVSETDTVFSPDALVQPYIDDPERGYTKGTGPLVDRPVLAVSFFTPLLGSLLLNSNAVISESVRSGVVSIIARLRRKSPDPERWGAGVSEHEPDERRVFASQTGPHSHDIRPFDDASRTAVEAELLQGIVLGMGQLATEMPDNMFQESLEDEQRYMEGYNQGGEMDDEAELFRAQLIAEATAGRATSLNLIGSICEEYSGQEAVDNGFVDEVLRCGDGDVAVRAEAAVALSLLAKTVPIDQINQMVPVFEALLSDPSSHVRQSACLCLAPLCERIDSADERRALAISTVETLSDGDYDVRCALLEMMGEVIYAFRDDGRGPPTELLEVYMDAGDEDPIIDGDWAVVASFNLPGVCLTLGPDRWPQLRELYRTLQQCAGDKVIHTLAASLHELAKILHPADVDTDLVPVYKRCLNCADEIRERVFEHVDVFLSRLPEERAWELFLDLAHAWADKDLGGWRAREQLATHIPSFFGIFIGKQRPMEVVLDITKDALSDPFAAVREAAIRGMPLSYERLEGEGAIAEAYRNMLLDLSNSGSYRARLTFLRCIKAFIQPPPNRTAFEEFFLQALPRLSQDVVDVRIGLAQVVADLFIDGAFYHLETSPIPGPIRQLVAALAQDDAVDVRDIIRRIDMLRVFKGKNVPPATQGPGTLHDLDQGRGLGTLHDLDQELEDTKVVESESYSAESAPHSDATVRAPATADARTGRIPSAELAARMGGMHLDRTTPLAVALAAGAVPEDVAAAIAAGTERHAAAAPGRTEASREGRMKSPTPGGTPGRETPDPFAASFEEATHSPSGCTP